MNHIELNTQGGAAGSAGGTGAKRAASRKVHRRGGRLGVAAVMVAAGLLGGSGSPRAGNCGVIKVQCGMEKIVDGARCGTEKVTDGAGCGFETLEGKAHCGVQCIESGFKKCTCKKPKSCEQPKSCDQPCDNGPFSKEGIFRLVRKASPPRPKTPARTGTMAAASARSGSTHAAAQSAVSWGDVGAVFVDAGNALQTALGAVVDFSKSVVTSGGNQVGAIVTGDGNKVTAYVAYQTVNIGNTVVSTAPVYVATADASNLSWDGTNLVATVKAAGNHALAKQDVGYGQAFMDEVKSQRQDPLCQSSPISPFNEMCAVASVIVNSFPGVTNDAVKLTQCTLDALSNADVQSALKTAAHFTQPQITTDQCALVGDNIGGKVIDLMFDKAQEDIQCAIAKRGRRLRSPLQGRRRLATPQGRRCPEAGAPRWNPLSSRPASSSPAC